MATITGSSLIRTDSGLNADSSDITRVYTDNGLTLDHGAGTATTNVNNSSNFSNTFNEADPFHLNVNSIQQTSNNGLTLENGTIAYLHAPTTLPASDATIQNNGVNTFRNITWLAANGGTGTAWGWGIRGTGSNATGETTNCRFLSADGTIWFINLEDANAAYIFANNELTDAVLNIARTGAVVDGISFGDTARFQAQSGGTIGYTMRVQAPDSRNSVLINNIFNGTTYNTGGNNVGRGQYQITYNAGSVTLINERHATDDIFISAFAGTRGSDIILNYGWNPQFRDGNNNSDIVDTRLVNVTDTLTRRVPFTSSNTTLYGTLFPSIIEGETPMHANSNGYIIQTINHTATFPHNQITNIGSRVLDLDGNLIATPKTYNVKSYTHDLPTTVTTGTTGEQVSQITNAGGSTGTFGWDTEDLTTGALDTNVLTNDTTANIAAYNGSSPVHITPRALYSRTKAVWYLNSLLENFGTTVNTDVSGEMAFQKPVTFTSTAGVVNVTDSLVTIPVSNAAGIAGDAFFNTISTNDGALNISVPTSDIGLSSESTILGNWTSSGTSTAPGFGRVSFSNPRQVFLNVIENAAGGSDDFTKYLANLQAGDTVTVNNQTRTIVSADTTTATSGTAYLIIVDTDLTATTDGNPVNVVFPAGTIDFNNADTGSGLTLSSNFIENWSGSATHSNDLTVDGNLSFNLTNITTGDHEASSIFGVDQPNGTGSILVNSDTVIRLLVRDTDTTRFVAGTNVTLGQDNGTTTVEIEAGVPNCWWYFTKNNSTNTGVDTSFTPLFGKHDGNTTTSVTSIVNIVPGETADTYTLRLLGENVYSSTSTTSHMYGVAAYTVINNHDANITVSPDINIISSVEFADPLTRIAEQDAIPSEVSATLSLDADGLGVTIAVSGTQDSSVPLNGAETMRLVADVLATDVSGRNLYLQMTANTNLSEGAFEPTTNGSIVCDQNYITFTYGDDVVQTLKGVSGVSGSAPGVVSVTADHNGTDVTFNTVIFDSSGVVPPDQVTASARDAIDSSDTNRRVRWQTEGGNRTSHFKPNPNGTLGDFE